MRPRFSASASAPTGTILGSWRTHGGATPPRRVPSQTRRRRAGLAHNDTDESLQRLLAESWPRRLPFAHFATAFVTYLRRFAQSVTTLDHLARRIGLEAIGHGSKAACTAYDGLQWLEAQFDSRKQTTRLPWAEPGRRFS